MRMTYFLMIVSFVIFCGACGNKTTPFVASPGVIVLPSAVSLTASQTQQFEATVVNTSTSVLWSVDGGDANGSIDQNGLYTAPASISEANTVVVRAKLSNNTSTQATADIDLTP